MTTKQLDRVLAAGQLVPVGRVMSAQFGHDGLADAEDLSHPIITVAPLLSNKTTLAACRVPLLECGSVFYVLGRGDGLSAVHCTRLVRASACPCCERTGDCYQLTRYVTMSAERWRGARLFVMAGNAECAEHVARARERAEHLPKVWSKFTVPPGDYAHVASLADDVRRSHAVPMSVGSDDDDNDELPPLVSDSQ